VPTAEVRYFDGPVAVISTEWLDSGASTGLSSIGLPESRMLRLNSTAP